MSESVKKRKVSDLGDNGLGQMRPMFGDPEAILFHKDVADPDEPLSSEPEVVQRQLPEQITCLRRPIQGQRGGEIYGEFDNRLRRQAVKPITGQVFVHIHRYFFC